MIGHRILGQYHIIHNKKIGTWFIYKWYGTDTERCVGSRAYLKDAVAWCRVN